MIQGEHVSNTRHATQICRLKSFEQARVIRCCDSVSCISELNIPFPSASNRPTTITHPVVSSAEPERSRGGSNVFVIKCLIRVQKQNNPNYWLSRPPTTCCASAWRIPCAEPGLSFSIFLKIKQLPNRLSTCRSSHFIEVCRSRAGCEEDRRANGNKCLVTNRVRHRVIGAVRR